ncbi:MAG: DNA repair exonuclease [Nitrososphaerales archaeon]
MTAVRFLHTSDWQLGMKRVFLEGDAQTLFSEARLDAVRRIGALASDQDCAFAVVCGDVFESNRLEKDVIRKALDAMGTIPVPLYLLPGNHDPIDAASIYRSRVFLEHQPKNVVVLEEPGPREVAPGVELVAAPWPTKSPSEDLVAAAVEGLTPSLLRIVVGHGAVDTANLDAHDPALIHLADLDAALGAGVIHYVALGDRHSLTSVGDSGRVWYAGTPEPTAFDEIDPGKVLVVELDNDHIAVDPHIVGTWRFLLAEHSLDGPGALEDFKAWLTQVDSRRRTVLRLRLKGTLTLRERAELDEALDGARDVFAALEVDEDGSDLALVPDATDAGDLDLTGFARTTLQNLQERARGGGTEAQDAQGALRLLYRLAREAE